MINDATYEKQTGGACCLNMIASVINKLILFLCNSTHQLMVCAGLF